jgi:dUTP pyrophosphatase
MKTVQEIISTLARSVQTMNGRHGSSHAVTAQLEFEESMLELFRARNGDAEFREPMQVMYRDDLVRTLAPLKHAKPGDCGFDLAYAPENSSGSGSSAAMLPIRILPGTFKLIPTGVYVKIPDGYFGLLCGRSSTFGKRGLFVVESRIDSGYTGELFVKLWHPAVSGGDFEQPVVPAVIEPWQRVAQLVLIPFNSPLLEIVDALPATQRGNTGFGSSGV